MSLVFGIAHGPDLLRLVAVPVLGWAALRDVRTRRVPNRTWLPLVGVGIVALAWDALLVSTGYGLRLFALQVGAVRDSEDQRHGPDCVHLRYKLTYSRPSRRAPSNERVEPREQDEPIDEQKDCIRRLTHLTSALLNRSR